MSNLELRIEEEASLELTLGESSDMSFDAVDFVGVPFSPTIEVEDIEGGHRVLITSMGAEGKKTDEFDVMDGADGATGTQGPKGDSYEITAADYAEIAEVVEEDIQDVIDAAQDATSDATAAAAEARAASAATWLSGNVLFGELEEAAVLTADDAFAAPPKGVEVYGKSTQDGTPTPDAPVEIKSVDDLTLHVCGKNLFGGTALRDAILAINPNSVTGSDANGSYVTNPTNATMNGATVLAGPFKSNTVYTIVLAARSSTTSAHAPNIWVYYTDGTYSYLTQVTNTYSVSVFSTASNKTVKRIAASWSTGTDYYYYDSCGIFEGVLAADQFEPYVGQSVEIPFGNHIARSLPDGTRDTLTLTYIGPSTEHEGWGVFGAELVQNVGEIELDGTQYIILYNWRPSETAVGWAYNSSSVPALVVNSSNTNNLRSDKLAGVYYDTVYSEDGNYASLASNPNYTLFIKTLNASLTTRDAISAWLAENPIIVQYPLATPITHDLGTVELPVNPAPDLTAWADGGSAQPTMQLEYERALSIVIPRIEAAISDLATS